MSRKGWEEITPAYRQRLERQGITRKTYESGTDLSVARGHAKRRTVAPGGDSGSRSVKRRESRPDADERINTAVQRMAQGASLTQAAREAHVAPERLRTVARERGFIAKTYRQTSKGTTAFAGWLVTDRVSAPVLEANGTYHEEAAFDLRNGRTIGRYWSAVGQLRERGDPSALVQLGSATVVDVDGKSYLLQTDPNGVLAHFASLTDAEQERFGQNIGSEKVAVSRGRAT